MKTVLTYGTFDLFHAGHIRLLKRARSLGDRLIVGCSTDEFNALKGKQSVFSYEDRALIVGACKFVDLVIPESSWQQKSDDIRKYDVDIFTIGDDWIGKFDHLSEETGCAVTYLTRTPDISTTDVKSAIQQLCDDKKRSILGAVDHLRQCVDRL
ncbi:glycerol-3-phosphate cytidylyltransferase [Phaeobacter gallaeciensis]|uniref:glycerol-3-phosphate cytidylyltransferase n=1 Tax=Phaeobacter gallaeciensis TaxID=60890 RepID=UPI00237F8DD7|nr:glycerol-3-phosphate cytidylyltransferase [Phaeobacter gallaeciensis]MDE4306142.1 glycerol-3-phosphate cytidylyltransferase [Phaeobacter gallaeciensis]MDE4310564.1 glycerol-3-phosphate cytidylyltransferase [Phaeobacter gallaeciensis]MDE4315024.1 glycerol-3-phosphate cytidylyltransferase [Phaeobacter gallaeciensis]MDE4319499.1 glycerol-3-phosphate cytidylyltransferase [Phaeobacter gallaeciensis]MDE4323879.1 glycerol-3-phosphate cytidylyltransferase [Phaeobacter gallaeciensis]